MSLANIKIIDGDIFTASEDYFIAHQCNCVTTDSRGLAKSIFDRFPDANTYNNNQIKRIPGQISIHGRIINLYAQKYPGYNKYNEKREIWFRECLNKISYAGIKKIAMPELIGCDLACGDPIIYRQIINEWSLSNPDIDIVSYRYNK